MLRKFLVTTCVLALGIAIAWAGETATKAAPAATAKTATASAAKTAPKASTADMMQSVKAEMMKCAVCKNMAAHLDELGPVMTMDVAKLNDGVAIIHGVSDPTKAALFHASCEATHAAGQACMTMTDEQAKTQLCPFCQEMRAAIKAGAKMSAGETKTGDVMVLTSSDPAVQAKIGELAAKCAMIAESM